VITASRTSSPSTSCEKSLISARMKAEISSGLYWRSRISILTSPLAPGQGVGEHLPRLDDVGVVQLPPDQPLTAKTVFCGLVIACRLAIWPTSRSPSSAKGDDRGGRAAPLPIGQHPGHQGLD